MYRGKPLKCKLTKANASTRHLLGILADSDTGSNTQNRKMWNLSVPQNIHKQWPWNNHTTVGYLKCGLFQGRQPIEGKEPWDCFHFDWATRSLASTCHPSPQNITEGYQVNNCHLLGPLSEKNTPCDGSSFSSASLVLLWFRKSHLQEDTVC